MKSECFSILLSIYFTFGRAEYLDMSYDVGEESMFWPVGNGFTRADVTRDYQPAGYWYHNEMLSFPEHISTHMDAPSHFAENGWTVDQIPLEHLMGPAVKIDISDKVASDQKAILTTDDLSDWWRKYGDFPNGTIVFVYTGWGSRYGNQTAYFGSNSTNSSTFRFPAISVGAAQILTQYERTTGYQILGVGMDTPSLDESDSQTFKVHQELFAANIYGLENVANLEKLPVTGATVTIMPIKIKDGSGGPVRIIAKLPEVNAASDKSLTRSSLSLLLTLLLFIYY
ncbi:unnamed protein product [Meganyctiphanes norvegica]|uniref:Kynurenine formamidase n=1 Tax=Meganyctiphanes norvegica TaxID=48144 RepID=A0AAV2S8H4_MEGNR